ncbi:hypothetical protein LTR08_009207 [Meristemomyces frigidus]|nr:hypothetical protein LTR08_009207 [Meristemomyces frigidus]
MTKRRRIDDGGSGDSSGGDVAFASWNEPHGQPSVSQSQSQQFPNTYHAGNGSTADYGTVTQDPMGEKSRTQSALGSIWAASLYPDVSSYQQPYFYQQTDPAIYTSPWPPTQDIALLGVSLGVSSSTYAEVMPVSGSILPFFPTQTQREQDHGFDARHAACPEFQGLESMVPYEEYGVTQAQSESSRTASKYYFDDASLHLKLQSLPILDNLATQIIQTIARASFSQVQDLMRGQDADECQAYTTLKNLFEQTRKVYSRETPFIDFLATQMFQPSQQEVMRKANVATFISSVLGGHDIAFYRLNEFFLETFVPMGNRLLKWQGALYLELKTQTYISALMNGESSSEAMLDELFPPDLDAQILTRHPDAPSLGPSEQDFIDRSRQRKSYLRDVPSLQRAAQELPKRYQWNDFLREFATGISKNVDSILHVPLRSQPAGTNPEKRADVAAAGQDPGRGQQILMSTEGQAVATSALSGAGVPAMPPLPKQSPFLEKKTGTSSTVRQPWTKPEEDALLEGLGKVNGPHWSQILARHGRGGSVSELLKDRNQVQLKDKARNLKLWYLKMDKEVPMSLRGVTGELRKRGGARARAALGLLDEEQDGGAGADGEDAEGEHIDPNLGARQGGRQSRKTRDAKKI